MTGEPGQGQPNAAITAARFSLTIDGVEVAAFSELVRITSEVEPAELMESTDKEVALKKLPGKTKPATLVLKRGKNSSMELWAWHEAARSGNIAAARKNCSLVMYDTHGQPVARYHLEQAWPSTLEIGTLKAGSNEVLTETITIVAERIQRVSV